MKFCGKCGQQLDENSTYCEKCGETIQSTNSLEQTQSKHNFFWKIMNYATLDKAEKRKFAKQTFLGGLVCVLLIPIIAVLSVSIPDAFKNNDTQPVNGNVYSDSSSKATSSKDTSSENSGNSTGNIVSFNSNSGALYTYTLKEFNDRINETFSTGAGIIHFDYSKWQKRDLQKQEKSGVEFTSYTYFTGETQTGMIEVCVENKNNHVLGINIVADSSADGESIAAPIMWSVMGCDPDITAGAMEKIMDRLLDNLKNNKYEMFCYNNSAFELYKENGMIQVSILPISDAKIKENKLAVIS